MFIIWRGFGFLVPIIIIIFFLATWGAMNYLFKVAGLSETVFQYAVLTASLAAAAVANWFAGRWFNRVRPRELLDPSTGQIVMMKKNNDLFFIPMQYWSFPVAILALVSTIFLFR